MNTTDSYEKYAIDKIGYLLDDEMMQAIPMEDRLEILVALSIAMLDTEYEDNFRIFPNTYNGHKQYTKIKNEGCCGFFDSQMRCKSGKSYLYGFNYGH